MRSYYVCKYYFNASHSFNSDRGTAHTHTFTVVTYIGKRSQEEADLKIIDNLVTGYLKRYEGKYLNGLPEFEGKDASIETLGDIFYATLKILFRSTPFSLYQLDISDNPLSVYQVADRILLPTLNMENTKENYNAILNQRNQLNKLYEEG